MKREDARERMLAILNRGSGWRVATPRGLADALTAALKIPEHPKHIVLSPGVVPNVFVGKVCEVLSAGSYNGKSYLVVDLGAALGPFIVFDEHYERVEA